MKQFNLLLVASVILVMGTACQKAADRKDDGQQGQQGDKPTPPAETVKSKVSCNTVKTYTAVKDGVSTKLETTIAYEVQSIEKDIDEKSTEAEYKATTVQKWFSVAEDGAKTELSTRNYIELGKSVGTFEKTEPNIYVVTDHSKGTASTLNSKTQKYDSESFDVTSESKYFSDSENYYEISLKIDGKDTKALRGRYKVARTSEQDGRIKVRTRTLTAPVQDNVKEGEERTLETAVRICREEEIASVDLAPVP